MNVEGAIELPTLEPESKPPDVTQNAPSAPAAVDTRPPQPVSESDGGKTVRHGRADTNSTSGPNTDQTGDLTGAPESVSAPATSSAPRKRDSGAARLGAEKLPPTDFELATDPEEKSQGRSVVTWFLILLAFLAIPAQVLWFQFEVWSKDETFRPIYAQICSAIGCELPVRRDVSLIVARNSVLRDHPEVGRALIYDALLVNRAAFAQPYPLVELTLTSGSELVASRRFKPSEYLDGDVKEGDLMQPRTPVHVSLEIRNPGPERLNFRVRFLPDTL